MSTRQQRRVRRSRPEIAGLILANAIKFGAAGLAFHEGVGALRPDVLLFASFLLSVGISIESSVNTFFARKR